MDRKNDTATPEQSAPDRTLSEPASKKRFRIEKIEERIAPGGHYNPQSKWVGGSSYNSSATDSGFSLVSGY